MAGIVHMLMSSKRITTELQWIGEGGWGLGCVVHIQYMNEDGSWCWGLREQEARAPNKAKRGPHEDSCRVGEMTKVMICMYYM